MGVIRSPNGNSATAHLVERMAAHKRAIFSLLSAGIAKHHQGNPAASLRIDQIYGIPVLLSGISSLIINKSEEKTLYQYYRIFLQLLKLHQATPAPVLYVLAGRLPILALLNLCILSLFGQICRLRCGNNILAMHGHNVLSSASPG